MYGPEETLQERPGWSPVSTDIVAARVPTRTSTKNLDIPVVLTTRREREIQGVSTHEKAGVPWASRQPFQKVDPHSKMLLELAPPSGSSPTDDQWSAILFHHGGFSPAQLSNSAGPSYTGEFVNQAATRWRACCSMADLYSFANPGKESFPNVHGLR